MVLWEQYMFGILDDHLFLCECSITKICACNSRCLSIFVAEDEDQKPQDARQLSRRYRVCRGEAITVPAFWARRPTSRHGVGQVLGGKHDGHHWSHPWQALPQTALQSPQLSRQTRCLPADSRQGGQVQDRVTTRQDSSFPKTSDAGMPPPPKKKKLISALASLLSIYVVTSVTCPNYVVTRVKASKLCCYTPYVFKLWY